MHEAKATGRGLGWSEGDFGAARGQVWKESRALPGATGSPGLSDRGRGALQETEKEKERSERRTRRVRSGAQGGGRGQT